MADRNRDLHTHVVRRKGSLNYSSRSDAHSTAAHHEHGFWVLLPLHRVCGRICLGKSFVLVFLANVLAKPSDTYPVEVP